MDKIDEFKRDVKNANFDDEAVEKMFFNLAILYKCSTQELVTCLMEMAKYREVLAREISDSWEEKVTTALDAELRFSLKRRRI